MTREEADQERSWERYFAPTLGAPEADAHTPSKIVELRRGLFSMWQVRHGERKIRVQGARASFSRVNAGSFLLLVVETGEAWIDFYSGSHHLVPGDALMLTVLEPFVFTSTEGFAALWIELPVWWLIKLTGGGIYGARARIAGNLGTTSVLRHTLHMLVESAPDSHDTDNLIDLFGEVLSRNLSIVESGAPVHEGLIDRINRYIARNYRTEGLSPKTAARELGCSTSSIYKACASAGQSFGSTLASMRLSVAAYALSRNPPSISAVAFDCGFSSLSHFCHAFKTQYGVTASSVRDRHSGIRQRHRE